MKFENAYTLIHAPLISEKSMRLMNTANQYVFHVEKQATKEQIQAAIATAFGVEVISVQTSILPGKEKRTRQHVGHRSDKKRAYVRLKAGQSIPLGLEALTPEPASV